MDFKPRIAIHHSPSSFSERWIQYCKEKKLCFQIVNCFSNNIVYMLKSFDILLWNWYHGSYRDVRAAPVIIKAAEKLGLVVFPSSETCRSFDNKVAQKYQLESIGAPLVPTYVFYDEKTALEWLEKTTFPKVFKLSRGAGSMNVRLVKNFNEGRMLVKKAFTSGFKCTSGHLKENFGKFISAKTRKNFDLFGKTIRLPISLKSIYYTNKMMGREIGYVYFQDFIPNLKYDTRIVTIGNRAFAFRRMVRKNDFRASGSGLIDSEPEKINIKYIKIAFETLDKLNLQCAAYDFVSNQNGCPFIIEVSYTFPSNTQFQVKDCPGHWDKNLNWHQGRMWPQDAILDDLLEVVRLQKMILE